MAVAVTTKASGGRPVVDVTATKPALGMPVTEAANGMAVTKVSVAVGGLPVTFVAVEAAPPPVTVTWPDATNTGYRGTPVDFAGDYVCTANGETISGKKFISGGVKTNGKNNITVVDCWFVTTPVNNAYAVNNITAYGNTPGTGLTVTHCTIDGYFVGIGGLGAFSYNDIKNMENGILIEGATETSVIQHNYMHAFNGAGGAHYDGVEMNGGNANVTIYHNRIDNTQGQTSCVMINNQYGAVSNISVNQNWLSGGTNVIYADAHFTAATITGISITDNLLVHPTNYWLANTGSTVVSTGNYTERGYYLNGEVPPLVGTIAFQPSNLVTAGSDNNPSTGFRVAATLAQPIGTEFRVVLFSGATREMGLDVVAFGKSSSGQVATAALTSIKFGGLTTPLADVAISRYVVSDWMPKGALTFPAASIMLVGFSTRTPAGGTGLAVTNTNANSYFGATGNVALANPSYTTSGGTCYALARIETR